MQEDLTDMRFGRLVVLKPLSNNGANWLCRCDCGNEVACVRHELVSGHKKSCGCLKRIPNAKDITGMRSGKLTAIELTDVKRRKIYLWRCKCDCGNEILMEPYKIRNGIAKSCGCTRSEKLMKDIKGQRFGKLTAIERLNEKRGHTYYWLCQCDCGNTSKVTTNGLLSGGIKSCGCTKSDAVRKTMEEIGTVADHVTLIDGTCIEKIVNKTKLQANNTSGVTGVQRRGNKWISVITFKKKVYYLGIYSKIEDAIKARKRAEEELFGEFLEWYDKEYPQKKKELRESKDDVK